MKHILLYSTTALILLGTSISAEAQTYRATKGDTDARILGQTQHIESEPTATYKPAPAYTEPRMADVEPAAGPRPENPYANFTGIYAGGDIGYAFKNDVRGYNGSLFLGYGVEHQIDLLGAYAGFEFGHEWSDADGNELGAPYNKDRAWVASFRPGVSIDSNALGYGIIGYSRAKFVLDGNSEYLDGLILGLGAQFNTNTPFKPRIEYTYTNYESTTIAGNSLDVNENNIKLGIVFQF